MLKSYLLLQDGILFEGKSFGAQTHSDGEIGCFLKKEPFYSNSNII